MKPLSEIEFKEKNILFAEDINDAFEKYDYVILQGNQEQFTEYLKQLLKLNGEENSYFDFYFSRLNEESRTKLMNSLSDEEKKEFQLIEIEGDKIFYQLKEEIISFLSSITVREILFSTFYFTNKKAMLWGNYDKKWPMFFEDEIVMNEYLELAKQCGLKIEQ